MNKKQLYEKIMNDVSKIVKRALLEADGNVSINIEQLKKFVEDCKKNDVGLLVNGNLFMSKSKNVGHSINISFTEKSEVKSDGTVTNVVVKSLSLCDTDDYGRDISVYSSKDSLDEYTEMVLLPEKDKVVCSVWNKDRSDKTTGVLFTNPSCFITAGPNRDKVKSENYNIFK